MVRETGREGGKGASQQGYKQHGRPLSQEINLGPCWLFLLPLTRIDLGVEAEA
jgi:hypothetical protein